MILSAQRHSTRHVWRLPRPPVSPVPHTKSRHVTTHVWCVSACTKSKNQTPRGARRGASICTGDQTIESSVVGCVEHGVERVCPVRWQCQRQETERETEKARPKCENGDQRSLTAPTHETTHCTAEWPASWAVSISTTECVGADANQAKRASGHWTHLTGPERCPAKSHFCCPCLLPSVSARSSQMP